jgi:hypothetical protein
MLLAFAALMFQFQAAPQTLPFDGGKDPDPAYASSLTRISDPSPSAVEANSGESTAHLNLTSVKMAENSGGGITPSEAGNSSANSDENGKSFSAIHMPEIQQPKHGHFESPERLPSRRAWFSFAIAEHGAAVFDAYTTNQAVAHGAVEKDPFMRPFAGSPAIYASTQVGPFLFDFIARRMQRSENGYVRRMWWAPQSISLATSILAGVHNIHVANEQTK